MPIKIFATPGDHRDDFIAAEEQFNEWEAECKPKITGINSCVEKLPTQRDIGSFMITIVVRYES